MVWTLSFEKMWLKQEISILKEIALDGSRGFIRHPPEFSLLCNSECNRLDIHVGLLSNYELRNASGIFSLLADLWARAFLFVVESPN